MLDSSCTLAVILVVVMAGPALAQKVPDVQLNGGGPNAQASDHQIVASGSSVYAVWRDRRANPNNPESMRGDVYFNRSVDGGATWLLADVQLNLGSAPMLAFGGPRIAIAGGSVCVVWRDLRNNPSPYDSSDIYCNRSLDGGTTWLPSAIRLDTGTTGVSADPCITASGASFYVLWVAYRNGGTGVYCNRSVDDGRTWLPTDVLVYGTPYYSSFQAIDAKAWGASLYVCWHDFQVSYPRYNFSRSLDGGLSWLPYPIGLGNVTATHQSAAQLAAWGPFVYVVWSDARNGNTDLFFNRSSDGGATWQPADVRLDTGDPPGHANSTQASIAAVDASVYVAWMDDRLSPTIATGPGNIYWNCSADFGATWLPADVRLDHVPTPTCQVPQVAADGASVQVAWVDGSGPLHGNVYCNRSLDRGVNWLPRDVRLNTAMGTATVPSIAASGSSVYVAWLDWRNQHYYDLYFNLASGFQPYGTGTAGSSAIVPVLAGSGQPCVSGTAVLGFDRGLGGTPGLLAVGFQPGSKIALPLLGGTLLVLPAGTSFFALGGAAGLPGAGNRSLLVPVPNDLNLLGLNANWQGLFLDPGAVQGVSMSNALETWFD